MVRAYEMGPLNAVSNEFLVLLTAIGQSALYANLQLILMKMSQTVLSKGQVHV